MKKIMLFSLVMLSVVTVKSQSLDQKEHPAISVKSFEWLTGYWVGDGFGGISEEIWSPAEDNTMMGMFRHTKDGEVTFYEFMHLTAEGMKIKHFSPDLIAWEEKDKFVTFPLIEVTADKLIFNGLEIWRKSEDEIQMKLTLNTDGKIETEIFNFKRKTL